MQKPLNFNLFFYRLLGALFTIFLALHMMSCTKKVEKEKKLGEVKRQNVIQKVSLNGTIRGLRQSQLQTGYPGYIGKIYVKVGDKVKEGQPLVVVTQTVDQPLAEVFPIRAPFNGTITQILKRQGEYVTTSDDSKNLLVINDLRQMWIDAAVPEVEVGKIALGLEAVIKANALQGRTYKGKLETLSLSPRQATDRWDRGRVEYPSEIRVENPDEKLRPGMTVIIDIISAKVENVLTIRNEYVRKNDEGFYLVDEKGVNYPIKTGLSNEEMVEVVEGAPEGLKVEMIDFGKI